MSLNWCFGGTSASPRSLPRYDDSPRPPAKIVSARPETIWLARSVIDEEREDQRDRRAPTNAAVSTASEQRDAAGPGARCIAQNPITAPTSIIPSTPRLSTPERSASSSPSAANRIGVP